MVHVDGTFTAPGCSGIAQSSEPSEQPNAGLSLPTVALLRGEKSARKAAHTHLRIWFLCRGQRKANVSLKLLRLVVGVLFQAAAAAAAAQRKRMKKGKGRGGGEHNVMPPMRALSQTSGDRALARQSDLASAIGQCASSFDRQPWILHKAVPTVTKTQEPGSI
eukprot:6475533-Amphidinium_carterae.1